MSPSPTRSSRANSSGTGRTRDPKQQLARLVGIVIVLILVALITRYCGFEQDIHFMIKDQVAAIDGDTLKSKDAEVRLYGIDAPERGERCFREAKQRNEALVVEEVSLLPDARDRDRSGRLLRYVFTEGGASIEALLIAEGLGRAWREDGTYRDALVALEAEARAVGVGCLWER